MSLNLLVGYTGLLSVAHAAFNGIGAYAVAILLTQAGWSFFPALLIGVLLAMLVALLMGLVLGKFKDDYYTIATVGFGIIAVSVFRNWQSLT
ncbi:MAG TPA: branched-chain amino acid ABC transporter permease, partial [Candidatus Paceibacterota bacterium]